MTYRTLNSCWEWLNACAPSRLWINLRSLLLWVYHKAVQVIATKLQNVTSDKEIKESKFCCEGLKWYVVFSWHVLFLFFTAILFPVPLFLPFCNTPYMSLDLISNMTFPQITPGIFLNCRVLILIVLPSTKHLPAPYCFIQSSWRCTKEICLLPLWGIYMWTKSQGWWGSNLQDLSPLSHTVLVVFEASCCRLCYLILDCLKFLVNFVFRTFTAVS